MTTALEGGEMSPSRPGRSLPPGKTRYPLYRRLGWPQGRYGQVRKTSSPPGLDPRTVQPVASRYSWPDNQFINKHLYPAGVWRSFRSVKVQKFEMSNSGPLSPWFNPKTWEWNLITRCLSRWADVTRRIMRNVITSMT